MTQTRDTLNKMLERARERRKRLPKELELYPPVEQERRLANVDAEIENLVVRLSQIDDRQREANSAEIAALAAERERSASEEASFWYRRFFTTLGLGNAAAFAAVASGFIQADDRRPIADAAANALTAFSIGMVAAGALPLLLWLQIETRHLMRLPFWTDDERGLIAWFVKCAVLTIAAGAALFSASALFQGFGYAIGGVRGLVQP
jgi:hypothetical protein